MNAAATSVSGRISEIISREFEIPAARVVPEADLYDDLGLDSLDAIDLVVAIEKTFGFKVEEGSVKKIRTVEQLCAFVADRA